MTIHQSMARNQINHKISKKEIFDRQQSHLLIVELLNLVKTIVDNFFDVKFTARQIIPDNLEAIAFPFEIKSKALEGKLKDRAIIELLPKNLGLSEKSTGKKKCKSWQNIEEDYKQLKQNIQTKTTDKIIAWLNTNSFEVITQERIEIIKKICEIFGLMEYQDNLFLSWLKKYGEIQQISEQAISWIMIYALETTKIDGSSCCHLFYLTTSLGGDVIPPPYVESYLIEPLIKLSLLKQLYLQEKIRFIPQFFIISSLHTQPIENSRDSSGNILNANLHIYNSRITLIRLFDFIKTFFPHLNGHCEIIEFPGYQKDSLARLLLGCLWKYIPIEEKTLNKFFAIKGDRKSSEEQKNQVDELKILLGNEVNPYVSRHLFSNMIFSHAHTLKFASDATEPQFHLSSISLYSVVRKEGDTIIKLILSYYQKFSQKVKALNVESIIENQILNLPPMAKIHGQLGMADCHACYYKYQEEMSLKEILTLRHYSAKNLKEKQRQNKAKKLEKTFARSVELLGQKTYLKFLELWAPFYITQTTEEEILKNYLDKQKEIVQTIIVSPTKTAKILNYYLRD